MGTATIKWVFPISNNWETFASVPICIFWPFNAWQTGRKCNSRMVNTDINTQDCIRLNKIVGKMLVTR